MDPVRQNYGFIAPSPAATEPGILPAFLRKSYFYISRAVIFEGSLRRAGPGPFPEMQKRVRKAFFRALYGCGGRPVFSKSGVFICPSLHWLTEL